MLFLLSYSGLNGAGSDIRNRKSPGYESGVCPPKLSQLNFWGSRPRHDLATVEYKSTIFPSKLQELKNLAVRTASRLNTGGASRTRVGGFGDRYPSH